MLHTEKNNSKKSPTEKSEIAIVHRLRAKPRAIALIGFLACVCAMATAYALEHFLALEPCKLCYLQRAIVITLGATFLIASLHNPKVMGYRLYALLCTLLCIAGHITAGRHIWLQHLPKDRIPACGPSIDYMLDVFSYLETLKTIWEGAGDCADVSWRFLGLTLPEHLSLYFIGMTLLSLLLLNRPASPSN